MSQRRSCPDNLSSADPFDMCGERGLRRPTGRSLSGVLDAVYKAAGEQAGPAVPLQRAFEPAVFPLPVNKHNVALLKFQLGLALGRI